MIDFFIERMTVLGRGLVFQPVLVTQTCTYNSNNIITLQNSYITDFPSKSREREREGRGRERERERETGRHIKYYSSLTHITAVLLFL